MMNDPHVVALFYNIKHDASVVYSKAKSLNREEKEFRIRIENENVTFTMKKHYATETEAREVVEEYICVWELDAALRMGPNAFKLQFERVQIEDQRPTAGVVSLSEGISFAGVSSLCATATVCLVILRHHLESRSAPTCKGCLIALLVIIQAENH